MDPNTVIALLSLNLIGIGGLLLLIALRMADAGGLRGFGYGTLCFGASYLLRLILGQNAAVLLSLLSDAGMIFAGLCFINGLQRFSSARALPARVTGLVVLAYLAVAAAATAGFGSTGRFALVNLALCACYGTLARRASVLSRSEIVALRAPMRLLAAMMGGLSLATMVRFVAVMWLGPAPLFVGPWAQAFFMYSIAVTMLLGPNLLWMVFMRLNDRLNELATHDPLTRLLNRRGLEEATRSHFGQRPPAPLVLLLVDVDNFKRINDTHGHAAGDALLQGLAHTLQSQVRAGDVVARWGGEEFLVCCQGDDADRARSIANRLRQGVESAHFKGPDGVTLTCTVSIGVSHAFADSVAWEAAARAADQALYGAKRAGRNRVVMSAGSAAARVSADPANTPEPALTT